MRRVLITGGGTGIGRAMALAFDRAGDEVTITGRRMGPLKETADLGRTIQTRSADIGNEAEVEALFDRPFDVVIANAGMGVPGTLRETSLEDFNTMLTVNITGVFLTFRAALDGMGPGGRLIAIASTASLKGGATIAGYAASKHGVLGLVRSVAQEVAKAGITCNAICPGFVDTEMAETAITGLMQRLDVTRERATAMVVSGNPMGRLIDPVEVADAALYLASPEARSVNGHALSISGGGV